MTSQEPPREQAAELRQKAEAIIAGKAALLPQDIAKSASPVGDFQGAPEDIARMLHELQVHQIELEMQNDELRQSQVEIDAARARYFDLYDLAPVGYCTVSDKGLILEANLMAATLLTVSRSMLVQQPFTKFIFREDQDLYYQHRKQLFETGEPQSCELQMVKPDGTLFWVHLEAIPIQDSSDMSRVCRITISDITKRKRADQSLQKSEFFFRESQRAASIGSYNTDFITGFWESSEVLDTIFGIDATYDRSIQGWLNIVYPEDRDRIDLYLREEVISQQKPFDKEYRIIRQNDNEIRWVHGLGQVSFDGKGNLVSMIGTIQDISQRKQAQNQSIKFSQGVEHSPISIAITDITGHIEYINPKFTEVTGYTAEDLLGTNSSLLTTEMEEGFYEQLVQTIFAGQKWEGEFLNRRKNGELFWERASVSPILDSDGQLMSFITLMEDITESKNAEKELLSLNRYLMLLSEVNQSIVRIKNQDELFETICQVMVVKGGYHMAWIGLCDLNTDGTVYPVAYSGEESGYLEKVCIRANPEHWGNGPIGRALKTGQIQYCYDIASDPTFPSWREEALKREYRSVIVVPLQIQENILGHLALYHNHVSTFDEREQQLLQELAEDISFAIHAMQLEQERNIFVAELKDYQDKLELKVEQRTLELRSSLHHSEELHVQLSQSLEKEKELSELKSRFVSMVSHEFRTPLSAILASSGMLERFWERMSLQQKQEIFQKIEQGVKHLSSLLDDVLTMNKTQSDQFPFEPVSIVIREFCQKICQEVEQAWPNHTIHLQIAETCPATIQADQKLLRHIVSNLLSNAAKYSSEGSESTFEWGYMAHQHVLVFRDQGLGIPEDDQPKVFTTFFRGGNVAHIPGTGLGLAIVQKSVEKHGGSMDFTSQLGQGSTFTVILPHG